MAPSNFVRNLPGCRRLVAASLLIVLPMISGGETASAAEPNWNAVGVDYVVVAQDLRDVLAEISNHLGISSFISEEIKGKVTQSPRKATMKETMDALQKRYGIVSYYDGGKIYYSLLKENVSQIISIGSAQFPVLRRQLVDLGVIDERFELKFSETGRSVFVSGPPRYVELVRQGVDAANAQIGARRQARDAVVIYGRKTTGL